MVEAFEQLWNALKSGEMQAILSALACVGVILAPIWTKISSYKLGQWKEKYFAKKEESLRLMEQNQMISKEAKELMATINTFVECQEEATKKTAELWDYVLDHSTLTSEQKAYAKETYTQAIKVAKRFVPTEDENKKAEELSTQTPTEDVVEVSPVEL